MVNAFRPSAIRASNTPNRPGGGLVSVISRWVGHMEAQAPEILRQALEPTFQLSQEQVPVKTGDLKRSGYLVTAKGATGAVAEIGYGRNGFPDYAVLVHENRGPYHAPPTKAGFLSDPFLADVDNIRNRLIIASIKAGGF